MTEREVKQLESIQAKLAEIKAKQEEILAKDRKRQQREKTRRLIKIGTWAEKYLRCENKELTEIERILRVVANAAGVAEVTAEPAADVKAKPTAGAEVKTEITEIYVPPLYTDYRR
jgi:hypothetical protein